MSHVPCKLTRFVVNGLRVHYKEKGQGERKVCLLGEPPRPYLSRKIIPLLAPFRALFRRPGVLLAVIASALWGTTTVLEKLAIEHMTPPSSPVVALLGTFLLVLLLTPGALRSSGNEATRVQQNGWKGLRAHPRPLALAVLIAGIAPLFGFTAIALGLVGYVTTLFKLSAILTILWAWVFLGEGQIKNRLLGASVMLVGGVLVAAEFSVPLFFFRRGNSPVYSSRCEPSWPGAGARCSAAAAHPARHTNAVLRG